MQKNKKKKIIGKTEFFLETGYILSEIIGKKLGMYKSEVIYKRDDDKTTITIRRMFKTYLTIELTEDELIYEVMIENNRKKIKYVKQEEIYSEDDWNKYEEQLKEDFKILVDYVIMYYNDKKDIEYCEFKYSPDYVLKQEKFKYKEWSKYDE